MKFKKKDIAPVLAILSAATDLLRPQHKYVKIKFNEDSAKFILFSAFGISIAEVPGETSGRTFTGVYAVNLLNSYIKSMDDDEDYVTFEKDKLILPFAEYTFDPFMLEVDNEDSFLKKIGNPDFTETVKCVSILDIAENFSSVSVNGMGAVVLFKDHVVASDRRISCIVNSGQVVENPVVFSSNFVKILKMLKVSEFDITQFTSGNLKFYKIEVGRVNFYLKKVDCSVEDYSQDKFKVKYEHEGYAVVDRLVIQKALGRMSMSVSENPDTRIYLKVSGENLYIENRDHSKSKEIVKIKAKFSVDEAELAVSCRMLLMLVNNIKLFGNDVYLYLPSKEDAPVLKLETEQHVAKFIQAGLIG